MPLPSSEPEELRSNDHLGLSRDRELQERIHAAMGPDTMRGSTGSRLISGNSELAMELESEMAEHYGCLDGLLFNSGYQANVGLLSALGGRDCCFLYDEKVHASMRDGIRLGFARSRAFRHNDPEDLERRLQKEKGSGPVFILSEGLFSMDGDRPPIERFAELAARYDASLIIDEAHSNGVLGPFGKGLVAQQGLEGQVFSRILPFGKAFAQQGAFVSCDPILKEFLIDHARSFIFSTAMSHPALIALRESFRYGRENERARKSLFEKVELFRKRGEAHGLPLLPNAYGPIQGVFVKGNEEVLRVERELRKSGFELKGIRKPSVPSGEERIRISLHADTPETTIEGLVRKLAELL